MIHLDRWAPIACAVASVGAVHRSVSAQSTARAGPPSVEVTLIGAVYADPTLDARIRSLFGPGTQIEFRRAQQLTAGAVLEAAGAHELYLWILLKSNAQGRIYVAMRDSKGAVTRYLFRDVALEAGLDEVGGETLSHIAHSSAMALWQSKQETSKQKLEEELAQDATAFGTSTKESSPPVTVGTARPPVAAPPSAAAPPKPNQASRAMVFAIGGALHAHHCGSEGWQMGPGGFLALQRQWSLRIGGSYFMAHSFDAAPASIRVAGGAMEIRAGWAVQAGSGPGLRIRPEVGIGTMFVTWHAAATMPAVPGSGETNRREYAVASVAAELPLGPIWLGARLELRVPFRETSYDVVYSGEPATAASSWLSSGFGVELGIPFTRSGSE